MEIKKGLQEQHSPANIDARIRLGHEIGHSSQEWGDVEMSYLREAYGMTRWEGENNESVYDRSGMRP